MAPTLTPRKCCVVISYYDRRGTDHLMELLDTLRRFDAGAAFNIAISVNQTSDQPLQLPPDHAGTQIFYRNNSGMNIGAWDHAWRQLPDYDFFLFLQDECYVVRNDWLAAFLRKLESPNAGLICESLNSAWDESWETIRKRESTVHLPNHNQAHPNRVDTYLAAFARWSTIPASTGRHARSLVWFLSRQMLEAIDGFPIGTDYGECIAAEIAVSQKVISLGFRVEQVDEEEFHYIRHFEWNRDHATQAYTKQGVLREIIKREKKQRMLMADPTWKFIAQLVIRRLRHATAKPGARSGVTRES
jgi:hypothetical protein